MGYSKTIIYTLRWRHNGHDGVSNHQPHYCLLNRLFGCRSKKTSKLRVTGLCAGNSPVTGQLASNAENVSIWLRHHDNFQVNKSVFATLSEVIISNSVKFTAIRVTIRLLESIHHVEGFITIGSSFFSKPNPTLIRELCFTVIVTQLTYSARCGRFYQRS